MENVVKNFDLVKEEISNFKNAPAALLSSAWYLTGDGIG